MSIWALAGASAMGSLLGLQGQRESNKSYLKGVKDTNAANLQISRDTNAQNLAMMREQNEWNLAQWNRENDYNSPVAQRARLLRAGINPASMVDNGSSASITSVAGAPAQAAHLQAPEPLPSPLSRLAGVGNDVAGLLSANEALKQSKFKTIRDGIDTYTYFDRRMVELQRELASLEGQENLNEEQRLRLADLPDEINHLKLMRDKASRNVDAEYDNLIKTGQKIEEETSEIRRNSLRLDDETAAKVARMKSQTAVDWFTAKTARMAQSSQSDLNTKVGQLTDKQKEEVSANIDKLRVDIRKAKTNEAVENAVKQMEASIKAQDLRVRTYTAAMAALQLKEKTSMSESEIKQMINAVFGIDVGTFFNSVPFPH